MQKRISTFVRFKHLPLIREDIISQIGRRKRNNTVNKCNFRTLTGQELSSPPQIHHEQPQTDDEVPPPPFCLTVTFYLRLHSSPLPPFQRLSLSVHPSLHHPLCKRFARAIAGEVAAHFPRLLQDCLEPQTLEKLFSICNS